LKTLRHFHHAVVILALGAAVARGETPTPVAVPLATALEGHQITLEASGNGRDQLTLTVSNPTPAPITVTIPAGLIATAGDSSASRMIVVRAALATVPAKNAVDVSLPAAALSSKNSVTPQVYHLSPAAAEPRLTALLATLADQPDAPRPTVQLAVLGLLEDINFSQWRHFLGTAETPQPTPAEVTQAVDALGLLRAAAPQQSFALGNDTELKLRALRNPWARAKAVALYGLDSGGDALAPDLRQLLHTQPGDNCPICRQRALMQKQADIP
jgi:hypothetical protein